MKSPVLDSISLDWHDFTDNPVHANTERYVYAIYWFAYNVLPRKIQLGVSIEPDLRSDHYMQDLPAEGLLCGSPKEHKYLIRLNTAIDPDSLLRTLMHELIHIWQYERGALVDRTRGDEMVPYWEGWCYANTEYVNQPWEHEAYALQNLAANCADLNYLCDTKPVIGMVVRVLWSILGFFVRRDIRDTFDNVKNDFVQVTKDYKLRALVIQGFKEEHDLLA